MKNENKKGRRQAARRGELVWKKMKELPSGSFKSEFQAAKTLGGASGFFLKKRER